VEEIFGEMSQGPENKAFCSLLPGNDCACLPFAVREDRYFSAEGSRHE
jgi:hypothetical protein